jgi:hypothetical protein
MPDTRALYLANRADTHANFGGYQFTPDELREIAALLRLRQRLAAALKRCDSEAVWDDLVDMWLVPNEVMDEIRVALREAGVES